MLFFFVNRMARGLFREYKSVTMELMRDEEDVERKKSTFLAFSLTRGARLASARAERAFLGLL